MKKTHLSMINIWWYKTRDKDRYIHRPYINNYLLTMVAYFLKYLCNDKIKYNNNEKNNNKKNINKIQTKKIIQKTTKY